MRTLAFNCLLIIVTSGYSQARLYENAEEAYVRGEHDKALGWINKKIDKDPTSPDYLLRALINTQKKWRSNAYDDFSEAIRLDQTYLEAFFHFGKFLIESNEYEKSVSILTELLERVESGETQGLFFRIDQSGDRNVKIQSIEGMEAEVLTTRSLALLELGMYDLALQDLNAAMALEPSSDKLVNRSQVYKKMDQSGKAIADLKLAVEKDPKYGLAWYNLFILDPDIELPRHLKVNQDFVPMLSARAVDAVNDKDFVLARKLYNQAIKLTPNDPMLLLNAGRLDLRNGFNQSALEKFERSYKLAPERNEALYLLGNAHFAKKSFGKAIEHYEQYLRDDPTNGDVWYNAAMCYMELENRLNACKCLERAEDFGMARAEAFLERFCSNE